MICEEGRGLVLHIVDINDILVQTPNRNQHCPLSSSTTIPIVHSPKIPQLHFTQSQRCAITYKLTAFSAVKA